MCVCSLVRLLSCMTQVEQLFPGSFGTDSHDLVQLRGPVAREIHHFWAEGLTVRLREHKVRSSATH
jgi:hypothetical protein